MTAKIEIVAVQPCGEGRLKDKKGGFRLEVTVATMCNGIESYLESYLDSHLDYLWNFWTMA